MGYLAACTSLQTMAGRQGKQNLLPDAILSHCIVLIDAASNHLSRGGEAPGSVRRS
jgi:hypothetical protein